MPDSAISRGTSPASAIRTRSARARACTEVAAKPSPAALLVGAAGQPGQPGADPAGRGGDDRVVLDLAEAAAHEVEQPGLVDHGSVGVADWFGAGKEAVQDGLDARAGASIRDRGQRRAAAGGRRAAAGPGRVAAGRTDRRRCRPPSRPGRGSPRLPAGYSAGCTAAGPAQGWPRAGRRPGPRATRCRSPAASPARDDPVRGTRPRGRGTGCGARRPGRSAAAARRLRWTCRRCSPRRAPITSRPRVTDTRDSDRKPSTSSWLRYTRPPCAGTTGQARALAPYCPGRPGARDGADAVRYGPSDSVVKI